MLVGISRHKLYSNEVVGLGSGPLAWWRRHGDALRMQGTRTEYILQIKHTLANAGALAYILLRPAYLIPSN
jgi:hypothetical protein